MRRRFLGHRVLACVCVAGIALTFCNSNAAGANQSRRDAAKPIVRVDVFGDSTALSLAWGLATKPLVSKYGYMLQDMGTLGCGVVNGPVVRFRGTYYLDHTECNGAPPTPGEPLSAQPWPVQWLSAMSTNHPNVVVVLAGRWEIVARVYNGVWTNIRHPAFANYVKRQLDLASNLITSTGANVIFMTAPCANEAKKPGGAPYPEGDPHRLAIYNELVRQVASEHPRTDSVIDLDALVCSGGKFRPDYMGVKIRTADGIHFTAQAGVILGSALMPRIVASGRAQIARVRTGVPVHLPG
jgi:hypothetical protein